MTVSRRSLLAGAGSAAAVAALSGCSGLTGWTRSARGASTGKDSITFTTWASDAEKAAFTKLVDEFQATHKGVTVNLRVVPYAEMFTNIDTELQAGTAPDVFRVDYPTLSRYSSTGQLLDLSDKIDSDTASDFLPALDQAVKFEGTAYGVPHQTDTTCIVYRPEMLAAAGITSVPDSLESAWDWEEWSQVAAKVKRSLGSNVHVFAYDWQQFGAYRWLTWLFEAGGRLLADDLTSPEIVGPEGRKALAYTLNFFDQGWTPRNTSVKGATYPDSAFISEKIAMAYVGNFLLPVMQAGIKNRFDWQVTYQPRDVRASTDLGGNALVAAQQSPNPELAAEFLNFMVEPANMKAFCEGTAELPTRSSLVDATFEYVDRPDLMPAFVEQVTTMSPEDVSQVTVPYFGEINTLLQNELDLCFTSGQSIDDTLDHIAAGVEKAAS